MTRISATNSWVSLDVGKDQPLPQGSVIVGIDGD